MRALELELERRSTQEKLRDVLLNPATKRYADAWVDPKSRNIIFAAANSIGKTYVTVALTGWTIWPETAPTWFREAVTKKWSFPKAFRIVSTVKEVEDSGSIQKAIRELWPKGRYQPLRNRRPFDCNYKTDNGWTGDVMTYEQAPDEFEGATLGLIIFNEPPPKEIYKRCVARTRLGGQLVFPMTPLVDAAWILDDLVDKASESQGQTVVIYGTLEDACKQHSVNGHLEHSEIERLINSFDPDEVQARVHGKFMHLSGRIFKAFHRDTFVSREPLSFQAGASQFQVIDPGGFNKPWSVIWGQVVGDPPHGLQIIAEWPRGDTPTGRFEHMKDVGMTVEDYVRIFKEVEGMGDPNRVHRIIDRHFANVKSAAFGSSLKDRLSDMGYDFVDSYSVPGDKHEVQTGILAVKSYLRIKEDFKKPMLLIDPRCQNTIRSLERWAFDPVKMVPNDDVWKNFCDVVRYLCAAELKHSNSISDDDWNAVKGPKW